METGSSYRTAFASLARTATPTPTTYDDINQRRGGGHFIIDVTAIGAAPSVVFNIEAFDPASQKWYALLISAAVTATGTSVLKIYPGVTPVANQSASDAMPSNWRIRPVHGNSDSITYSVGVRFMD